MFVPPEDVPLDRLISSATNYWTTHSDDPEAIYILARIHYLAFSIKRESLPAYERTGAGEPVEPAPDFLRDGGKGRTLSTRVILEQAIEARRGFDKAIQLSPQKGLYYLGLASLLEEVRNFIKTTNPELVPVSLQKISLEDARDAYSRAFALSYPEETQQHKPAPLEGPTGLISYEAAKGLVRLADEKQFVGDDEAKAELAKEAIPKLEKIPPGAITPVVFSTSNASHLSDFLASNTIVDFDLRGYGWRDRWPWVKPALGFLCWDPRHTGRITSARQLFGGYTFQIFRRNGYDALAALDDNSDGWLTGGELVGISVWFDRNGNGVADVGEVVPVQTLGIRAIATQYHEHDGVCPTNARGIVLEDGTYVRTWDWITKPVLGPAKGRPSPSVARE